jgi:hypothetical protein
MQYTDALAAHIAQTHNVCAGTIATWKNKGNIPEKYFLNGAVTTEVLVKLSKEEEEMLIRSYLTTKKYLAIHKFKLLNTTRFVDFMRGKGRLDKKDFDSYFDNLAEIGNVVAPVFTADTLADNINTLQSFFKESRVKRYSFHENKDAVNTILQHTRKKEICREDVEAIKETIKKIFGKIFGN